MTLWIISASQGNRLQCSMSCPDVLLSWSKCLLSVVVRVVYFASFLHARRYGIALHYPDQ